MLIPLFDSLTWHTKKEMDYIDWKTIFKIKNLGLDYGKGLEIIKLIASQMNNNRLSTAGLKSVDRTWLVSEIDKLLERETPVCNFSPAEPENTLETELTLDESPRKRLWSNTAVLVHLIEVSSEAKEFSSSANILNTFKSLADCAKYLNISTSGLQYRLRKDKPFRFKDKLVKIIRM